MLRLGIRTLANFVFKMIKFVFKMMNFVLKMMKFGRRDTGEADADLAYLLL